MKTEDLIVQLAASAEPVRPLASPMRRFVTWTIGATVVMLAGIAIMGPRADIRAALQNPSFLVMAVATLVTAVLAGIAAFVLSVPGAERSPAQHWLPIVTVVIWGGLLIGGLAAGGASMARLAAWPFHVTCTLEILGLSILPGALLFQMLRRAAPLRLGWSAALTSVATIGLAATATQVICPLDDPAHHLVAHFGPSLIFIALGGLLGRVRLRQPMLGHVVVDDRAE